jgi:hypothetical protein
MPIQAPLTFQQMWMWSLLHRYDNWNCVGAAGLRLRGEVNIPALERSLEAILKRHSSLRTRATLLDGAPLQYTTDLQSYRLDLISVTGASATEIEAHAQQLFETFSNSKIDLTVGPLFQVHLLRLAPREHWLLIAAHRFVVDCFSMDQILPEILSLYTADLRREPLALPTPQMEYHDYALRQQDTDPEWLRKHDPYWRRRLDKASNLHWPVDACVAQTPRGALGRMSIRLESALSERLRDIARRERTLLATVMLAVYVATLCRWCKQMDFVVPFFVAGRQSEHKYVVGYFPHMLYLRMELTGRESFHDLLRYVGNEFFRALSHQDFGRMATREPHLLEGTFFQWLTWHSDDGAQMQPARALPNLDVERISVVDFAENLTAIPPGLVDVEITVFDTSQGIYASGVYRADLFTPRTMQRFMESLRSSAEHLAQDPGAPILTLFGEDLRTLANSAPQVTAALQ